MQYIKVKPVSYKIALWGFIILTLITSLALFGVIDLTMHQANILIVISAVFLLSEASIVAVLKKRKSTDVINILSAIMAMLAILTVILSYLNVMLSTLSAIQGLVTLSMTILLIVEVFR
jgi:hypothetical protein